MPTPELTVQALVALLRGDPSHVPVLVDVRSPEEHAHVALPGSVLLPLPEIDAHPEVLASFGTRPVVVYCHHGVRSLHGAAYLRSCGLDARSLRGGIDAWSLEVDPTLPRY